MRTVFLCMELKIVYSFCFVWQIILFEQHRRQDLPLYILKWLPNLPRQVPLSQQQTNWRIYRVEVETGICIRVKPEVWLLSRLLVSLRLRGTLLGSSWKLCGRGAKRAMHILTALVETGDQERARFNTRRHFLDVTFNTWLWFQFPLEHWKATRHW